MLKNTSSWLQSVLLLHCIFQTFAVPKSDLKIIHSWTFANFEYPSEAEKKQAIQNKSYIPSNAAILDSDCYIDPNTRKKRCWVTTPKFLDGIPATLSEVRENKQNDPLMSPFPSWADQNEHTCQGPVSVYRIQIDRCGLLWVADSGLVDSFLDVPRQICKPKVLVYDLKKNDSLVVRYEFGDPGLVFPTSALNTIVVESYQSDCRDSVAYIADCTGRGLIVFDSAANKSWRVENPYFWHFPDQVFFDISGKTIYLTDGLFGLALSPPKDKNPKLYFHSLASVRESYVSTAVLKDVKTATDLMGSRSKYHNSGDIHPGQSTVEAMTSDGILIYPVLTKNALACWNTAKPMDKNFQHIILTDNENFQFISGLKVINDTLLITSCKLQNYIYMDINGQDKKYRVMEYNINKLLIGTPCRSNKYY